jgi:hypothetical protein
VNWDSLDIVDMVDIVDTGYLLWLASNLLEHCPQPKLPSWGNYGELG